MSWTTVSFGDTRPEPTRESRDVVVVWASARCDVSCLGRSALTLGPSELPLPAFQLLGAANEEGRRAAGDDRQALRRRQ